MTLTAKGARKLLDQIRRSVENLSDLIRSAWEQEAWKAAGYANWDECCQLEFPELRVTAEQRLRVVGELTESGMSDRAIAVALRISDRTVNRTRLERSGATNVAPSNSAPDRKVTGRDGKKYGCAYIPASEAQHHLRELKARGLTITQVAESTSAGSATLLKIKAGEQKTISTADARAVKDFYLSVFGAEPGPVVADVIPIQKKTGPQLNSARAEARHCLVNAAITLQKAARQISLVNPEYLQFGKGDQELEQAPRIIAESIKSINQSTKRIQHGPPATR